jgi:hypothetical protein
MTFDHTGDRASKASALDSRLRVGHTGCGLQARIASALEAGEIARKRLLSQIIYNSKITRTDPETLASDLQDILSVSLINNAKLSITGALMAHGGYFAQVLEGELGDIREVYGRISKDPRNHSLKLMIMGPIDNRRFRDWAMCICDPLKAPLGRGLELDQLRLSDMLDIMEASIMA